MVVNKLYKFIQNNKLESLLIFLVLVISLLLRLYKISDYLTFLGDEGRDVRIVRDLITKGNLVFIGPQTSIGNMYLGPFYYYMMAPALLLSRLNPVGPAIMNALLGTLTVFLTYFLGRQWLGKTPGLIAAILFALSPVAIIYSRSSWNPNPMPFFALLSMWGIYEVWQNKKFSWMPYVGIFFALALQMHYLGLLLAPTLFIFWLTTLIGVKRDSVLKSVLIKKTIFALALFFILMSPLVLFDLKHDGLNYKAFSAFFTDRQTTINLNPAKSDRFMPAIESVVSELLLGRQLMYAKLTAFIIAALSIWAYLSRSKMTISGFLKSKKDPVLTLLFTWIGIGILGLGVYKQHIYAHYFGFLFPAVYLLSGYLIYFVWQKKPWYFKVFSLSLFGILGYYAIANTPLQWEPNRQLWRTEAAADLIIRESKGEPFNFGLIAKQNYDESYRYFLENKNANMVSGDKQVADQLFVICEDGDTCQPEGHPQWQVAVFGIAHIEQVWQIDHLKIYKMVHTY